MVRDQQSGTNATAWRGRAGLLALTLVAASCASGPPSTGIAETGAGAANASDEASGGAVADAHAADSTGDQGAATSSASGVAPQPKRDAALPIVGLRSADEPDGSNNANVVAATLDGPNEGEITQTSGIDRWTLSAEAGQVLAIEIISAGDDCFMDLAVAIESPAGVRGDVGAVGGLCKIYGPFLLTESGDHVLEFRGDNEETTGSYVFRPVFLTEWDVNPLSFQGPNIGVIDELLGVDRWTFEASAGDQFGFDVITTAGDCTQSLRVVLEDPLGQRQEIDSAIDCDAHGIFLLETAGTYVLEFSGGDSRITTGEYRLIPNFVTERDEVAAVADTRLEGEISEPFGIDRWTFEATEGQTLTIERLAAGDDCDTDVDATLGDPVGREERLSSFWDCGPLDPITVATTGTYVIEVIGETGRDRGRYALTFSLH